MPHLDFIFPFDADKLSFTANKPLKQLQHKLKTNPQANLHIFSCNLEDQNDTMSEKAKAGPST